MPRFLVASFVLLAPLAAFAGSSANHSVTVTVSAINEVAVTGGTVALVINSGTSTGPTGDSDNSTAALAWTTNESDKKITVETNLSTIKFPLTVLAVSPSSGSSAGSVVLDTDPQDLVTGISLDSGGCNLTYSATATAGAGTGLDSHTVTYTIVDDS